MGLRIQFNERVLNLTVEELEKLDQMAMPHPKNAYTYRLTYPRLLDIFRVNEMPGKKNHCEVEFYECTGKEPIIVKGSYEEICIKIDDRQTLEDEIIIDEEEI